MKSFSDSDLDQSNLSFFETLPLFISKCSSPFHETVSKHNYGYVQDMLQGRIQNFWKCVCVWGGVKLTSVGFAFIKLPDFFSQRFP